MTLAGVALGTAGCGGGTPSATPTSPNAQDQMVKFADCLREHGLNASVDPQGHGLRIGGVGKIDMSKSDAAMKACRALDPKKDVNPNDPAVRDRELKMAQCLRAHGVNVQDPQPGQGLIVGGQGDQSKLEQADQECRHILGPDSPQP